MGSVRVQCIIRMQGEAGFGLLTPNRFASLMMTGIGGFLSSFVTTRKFVTHSLRVSQSSKMTGPNETGRQGRASHTP
jgi:hypothetical protein